MQYDRDANYKDMYWELEVLRHNITRSSTPTGEVMSVMRSYQNSFWGDVVLDSVNMASGDEDKKKQPNICKANMF